MPNFAAYRSPVMKKKPTVKKSRKRSAPPKQPKPNVNDLARDEFNVYKNTLSLGGMPLVGIFEAFVVQSRSAFLRGYELGFEKAIRSKIRAVDLPADLKNSESGHSHD